MHFCWSQKWQKDLILAAIPLSVSLSVCMTLHLLCRSKGWAPLRVSELQHKHSKVCVCVCEVACTGPPHASAHRAICPDSKACRHHGPPICLSVFVFVPYLGLTGSFFTAFELKHVCLSSRWLSLEYSGLPIVTHQHSIKGNVLIMKCYSHHLLVSGDTVMYL